ncbi:MAG TPA: tetratricopeptide repeat protein [Opitutus sp.]|nr:tetratricopeptide repeat protein [Opitutus sp.]
MNRVPLFCLFLTLASLLRAETPFESAVTLFEQKRYPEAAEAFLAIASEDPQSARAHFYLGVLADKRGENDEAIRRFERAVELDPENSEYHTELGGAYGDAAKNAGALASLAFARKCAASLNRAVELNPDNLTARNGLITFYLAAPPIAGGGSDKAYAQAEEIRKRDLVTGSAILGHLYLRDRKHQEAFAVYEAVLAVEPDNYQALYLIGRAASETGENLERGQQALLRCLELPPGPGEQGRAAVQWRLGVIAEKHGDIPAARAAYKASLQSHPGFQQAADSLARLK